MATNTTQPASAFQLLFQVANTVARLESNLKKTNARLDELAGAVVGSHADISHGRLVLTGINYVRTARSTSLVPLKAALRSSETMVTAIDTSAAL